MRSARPNPSFGRCLSGVDRASTDFLARSTEPVPALLPRARAIGEPASGDAMALSGASWTSINHLLRVVSTEELWCRPDCCMVRDRRSRHEHWVARLAGPACETG